MSNLLPEKNKKKFTHIYHMRLLIAVLICITLFWIIAIFFLIPSVLVYSARLDDVNTQIKGVRNEKTLAEAKELEQKVKEARTLLSLIAEPADETTLSNFQKILSYKNSGISFTYFSFSDASHTQIRGIAQNRQSLNTLVRSLEKDPTVIKVESPLSNIISERNILFTISVEWKKKEQPK